MAKLSQMIPQGTTRWWNGIPCSSTRTLAPEELSELAVLKSALLRRGLLLGLATVLAFLAFPSAAVFCDWLAQSSEDAAALAAILCGVGTVLGIAALFLRARDALRQSRALIKDIGSGQLEVYQQSEPDQQALVPAPLRRMNIDTLKSVEVLPASGFIWRVNGEKAPLTAWSRASAESGRSDVANLPESAAVAADWVTPFEDDGLRNIYHNNRYLTDDERSEIRRYQKKLLRFSAPAALLLTVWAIALLARGPSLSAPKGEDLFRWALIGGLAIYRDIIFIRCLLLAQRLGRDAQSGSVAVLRMKQEESSAALSAPQERLPFSGILWSLDGAPAEWRLRVR